MEWSTSCPTQHNLMELNNILNGVLDRHGYQNGNNEEDKSQNVHKN